ncbi:MAG: hypothetical protein EZS28_030231 [Streblomastix strix]|uniref:Protein kinase domain-containing protein n=1 Tax=Streblomastix strix TaxID=222440 RepID=A0A5J4UVX8_9EUKA|nr:MAG: hypothetical protein EZS28_030231 [Streblomastix strix]
MILILIKPFFYGTNYYVGQDGDDSKDCADNLCKTLQAATIKVMAYYATEFTVIIRGQTTISSSFDLSQTFSSPRTFTNNPDFSSTFSDIHIYENGQFIVTGNALFQMILFTKLDQATQYNGGAIYAKFNELSCNLQIIDCVFVDCKAIDNGGALSLVTFVKTDTTLRDMLFQRFVSQNDGGAFQFSINNGAKLTIAGSLSFQDCKTLSDSGYGGALYAKIFGENSYLIFRESVIFERCSGQTGGGMCLITQRKGNFTIYALWKFTNCSSSNKGGGIYLETNNGTINFNQSQQVLIENCTCDGSGGGIYCLISNNGQIQIKNIKLRNCNSQRSGGGIYAIIESGSQLTLDNTCELYQCESHGNGGGIYIMIDSTTQSSFIIKDAYIHECKSITNTSLSYPESGFGGGLFIGCNGDYNPSTELIDLHGMKIYNNSADKYGQSLYIAMRQVIEFCQYGIFGEYVKGNYSDGMSNENELLGIPMDLNTFNSSSPQTIEQQQQPLEPWWRILGILKSAQVVMNISNPNGKLIFHIEGKRMIPGYLNVKIFEFGDKTQENIDQEQKVINYQYNKNNLKSLKGTSTQSPISQNHEIVNTQQISIISNSRIEKNLHNYANEIIYPPEDGQSNPIQIIGEIQSEQKATFGMNEYQWLNYKEKVNGVLISNDRNIFTGKDGLLIEDTENAAVRLEVIIEEDDVDDDSEIDDPQKEDDVEKEGEQDEQEEKSKVLTVGFIVGIVVGALAIIAVIIIIIIVAIFISKKLSDFEKIKKIGKGTFGTVWKMKEIKSQRIVAIKEVDYDSDEEKQRFHKEVSVMRDVYHILQQASSSSSSSSSSQNSDSLPPFIHVVEPLGYFLNEDKDKAQFAFEYCENGDLRQYIQNMKNFGTEIPEAV